LGADFDAPVFGRGLALPKLGIVSLFLFYVNEHGQSKPQKSGICNNYVRRCGLVELR
jgi:hypothetical protein